MKCSSKRFAFYCLNDLNDLVGLIAGACLVRNITLLSIAILVVAGMMLAAFVL
ncbi:MAG TPA: hypothetical protein VHZ51_05840 [Ktedonobacteraceae bacterium]|jgi:hypothetical protein|nr:hypothetical protein [Ktedonobacteraceae bacterium]